jgi:hypothetical protein
MAKSRFSCFMVLVRLFQVMYLCMGITEMILILLKKSSTIDIGPFVGFYDQVKDEVVQKRVEPTYNIKIIYMINAINNITQLLMVFIQKVDQKIDSGQKNEIDDIRNKLCPSFWYESGENESYSICVDCVFILSIILGLTMKIWMFVIICIQSHREYFSKFYPTIWYIILADLSLLACIVIILIPARCLVRPRRSEKVTITFV